MNSLQAAAGGLVVYGDFNCPWSYQAAMRANLLATAGVRVDWRAVEHEPRRLHRAPAGSRTEALHAELNLVLRQLLPNEHFPYAPPEFVPYTKTAVAGYAEAYGAQVPDPAQRLLFEAFWVHGLDIGDPSTARPLLADTIRSGRSTSDPLSRWGYSVTGNGAPVTTAGWKLVRQWQAEWMQMEKQVVPVLQIAGESFFREGALDLLGQMVLAHGLDPRDAAPSRGPRKIPTTDLADPSWASQNGGRWLQALQDAHKADPFARTS